MYHGIFVRERRLQEKTEEWGGEKEKEGEGEGRCGVAEVVGAHADGPLDSPEGRGAAAFLADAGAALGDARPAVEHGGPLVAVAVLALARQTVPVVLVTAEALDPRAWDEDSNWNAETLP